MIKINVKGDLAIDKATSDKLNNLLSIEDFEEAMNELDSLGYEVDSCAFNKNVFVEGYTLNLCVFTGQTNAWTEFVVTNPEGETYTSEPIFEPICGEYFIELENATAKLNVYNK